MRSRLHSHFPSQNVLRLGARASQSCGTRPKPFIRPRAHAHTPPPGGPPAAIFPGPGTPKNLHSMKGIAHRVNGGPASSFLPVSSRPAGLLPAPRAAEKGPACDRGAGRASQGRPPLRPPPPLRRPGRGAAPTERRSDDPLFLLAGVSVGQRSHMVGYCWGHGAGGRLMLFDVYTGYMLRAGRNPPNKIPLSLFRPEPE